MQKKKSENWKWLNDSFASKQIGDEFQGGSGPGHSPQSFKATFPINWPNKFEDFY